MKKIKNLVNPASSKDDEIYYGTGGGVGASITEDPNVGKIAGEVSPLANAVAPNAAAHPAADSAARSAAHDQAAPAPYAAQAPASQTVPGVASRNQAAAPRSAAQDLAASPGRSQGPATTSRYAAEPFAAEQGRIERVQTSAPHQTLQPYQTESVPAPLVGGMREADSQSNTSLKSGVAGNSVAVRALRDSAPIRALLTFAQAKQPALASGAPQIGRDELELGDRWDPDADLAATLRRAHDVALASSHADKASQALPALRRGCSATPC